MLKRATLGIDFHEEIANLLDTVTKHPDMFPCPKRLEFSVCAHLAAWEVLALGVDRPQIWRRLWRERCRELHGAREGATLADAPRKEPPEEDIPVEERRRGYRSVLNGLKRVHAELMRHLASKDVPDAEKLDSFIKFSFRTGESLATPDGVEAFVHTLLVVYERTFLDKSSEGLAVSLWRKEIEKKRGFGPPQTRTLADVVPLEVRLTRSRQSPFSSRKRTLRRVVQSLHAIEKAFQCQLHDLN